MTGEGSALSQTAAEMRALSDTLAGLPPRPRCFMAHHSVPYGRVFRQWNTDGELLVWVNRGEVMDLPRRTEKRPDTYALIDSAWLFSVPVVFP